MGKKGDKGEVEPAMVSTSAEILALQAHIQKVEAMVQNQSLQFHAELKTEIASSQSKL
jgi:hypothetical protein